jgi:hypothetical protein
MRSRLVTASLAMLGLVSGAIWLRGGFGPEAVIPGEAEPSPAESLRVGVEEHGPTPPSAEVAQRVPASGGDVAGASSEPVLTFQGHLSEFVQRGMRGAHGPTSFGSGEPSVERVVANKDFNPDGKVLVDAALDTLQELMDTYAERRAMLTAENAQLTRAALVAAVERGQFVTKEQPRSTTVDPQAWVRERREFDKRAKADQQEMMQALTARLGRPMRDWGYSVCATTEPDGIARQSIVYFTRADAADVFRCRDGLTELRVEERDELRRFFASQP